jgi:signal transduction histidine kinase
MVTRRVGGAITVCSMASQAMSRFRRHRPVSAEVVDLILAAVLLAGGLGVLATLSQDGSPAIGAAWCVLVAGSVAVRRRAPLAAVLAAVAGMTGYLLTTDDTAGAIPPVAVVLTFYTLGRSGTWRRQPARAALVVTSALAACLAIATDMNASAVQGVADWLGMVAVPLAVGIGFARRNALSVRLAATAAQLRAERELTAARAAAEERNRVARDLHDVVAHCVSVMVVQAGAARLVADHDPGGTDRALAVIGDCGRDALVDLRRIVGVLRRNIDPGLGCGAGLADLGRLAERIRLAGVPVRLRVEGDAAMPPAVDLVAYRVVQEALTNVVKHAGDGATADVCVRVTPAAVTIEITDTGGAVPTLPGSGPGHGLAGMRERVTAYGGQLAVGPRPEDGFAVRARMPLQAGETARPDPAVLSARRRPSRWLGRPWWSGRRVDALIVIGWLVAMETEAAISTARNGTWALDATLVAAMALAAGWRRHNPLIFLVVVGALAGILSGGLTSLDRSTVTGMYSLAVPLFTVAAWQPRTRAVLGLGLWTAGACVVAVVRHASAGGLTGAVAMGVVVWAAGRAWSAQRNLNADLAETTALLAAERDQQAELAVASERTRIARELLGLVAHGVVTMVVQAEAARNLLSQQSGSAEDAIRAIEVTGRDALSQLRRILGVLRAPVGVPEKRAPGPVPVSPVPSWDGPLTSVPDGVLA